MKKTLVLMIALILAGCAAPSVNDGAGNVQLNSGAGHTGNGSSADSVEIGQPTPLAEENAEECQTGGEHPIAISIAADYPEITTYEEIVGWFCQGALFEDILSALTTEELTGVDAGEVLTMVAHGQSWEEIWLELGVTQE